MVFIFTAIASTIGAPVPTNIQCIKDQCGLHTYQPRMNINIDDFGGCFVCPNSKCICAYCKKKICTCYQCPPPMRKNY